MGSAPASLADNPFLITLLLEMQTTIFLRTEMSRKTEYVHNPCFLSANILKILGVFAENQQKENGNINICVKLAHKTMYKYHRGDNTFGISISNEMVGIPEYPIIKIWKTIIYKRM